MRLVYRGLTLLLVQFPPFISEWQEMEEEQHQLREALSRYQQAEVLE